VPERPPAPHDRLLSLASFAGAVAAMALAAAIGIGWGAFAIGGSDSHCYAGQAKMLAEGRFSMPPPVAAPVPWPNAAATFAPSGFAPGPDPGGASVPLCAAGLSVAMAVALKAGGDAALFLVVPLAGVLAVWSTFVLGRKLAGPAAGAGAAVLLACSPTFLYQLVQPMSDVPAAALWTASLALALRPAPDEPRRIGRALAAGLAAGAAVMMRPNLVPLALIPVLLQWPSRAAAAAVVGGVVPGVAAVALLQAGIYGSPLRSGYGELGRLFSTAHVAANLVNYPSWLAFAHTPALALGLAAPFVVTRRGPAWSLLAFVLGVFAAYLPYVPFADWWYSRFMLPGLPALIVLTAAAVERAASRLPRRGGNLVFAVLIVGLAGFWLHRAGDLAVFRLKGLEHKYVELGRLASQRLPRNAIVLAAQPAGSVRYYAGLPTLSWDAIDPAWLGLQPFVAVESWEMAAFRSRFRGHSQAADLDWPPRAALGGVIFVYDLADRDRYLAGEHVPTERVTWGTR
jgi:hypothetical protein